MAHNHNCNCTHETLSYCKTCRIVHCKDCNIEFIQRVNSYYPWNIAYTNGYTPMTSTGAGYTQQENLNLSNMIEAAHLSKTACTHEDLV